jgi:Cu+-exporting ATPase
MTEAQRDDRSERQVPADPSAQQVVQLKIGGMSCSFCANAIERGLKREKGVDEVHVSLAHEEALVRFRPDLIDEKRIKDTLRSLGYIVRDPRKVGAFDEQREAKRQEGWDLVSAGFFAMVLFLAMAAMWLDLWQMRDWHVWTAWAIATYVYLWNGRRIIRMAWGAARRGITNQHVLLSAGAIGAYIGGILGAPVPFLGWYGFVGFPAVDFFGVTVFLTAYHLLSGYVALVVRTRASESVRRLLEMQPPTARVLRDGTEQEIAIEDVQVGALVRVRPGERIPVDGIVEDGAGAVDQSIVTGEPIPEDKGPGDEVIGGSVNQTGSLLVRVSRIGEESFLSQVARHVEAAKAMKPGIIVLVDRVLVWYVPAVLTVALLAFLFWGFAPPLWGGGWLWVTAIYAAVTVLVMGYPCALGMATPLALIRGGGMAAERGILMRSGEAFQVLKDIDTVVFDKTGTITEGKPQVMAVEAVGETDGSELLRLAAAAESASEHPLGRAIVDAALEADPELPEARGFQATAGQGVEADVEGRSVFVGKPAFLATREIDTAPLTQVVEQHEALAHTAVAVAVDGRAAGVIAIADAIKPDAKESVATLKERGIRTIIITGDNSRTAEAVAAQVGVDEVLAQVLPDEKADRIRDLQRRGARVAMVGDGINDAPALMQAHVGIAIGAGTDIAIESSDVILIGERLGAVAEAREIGGMSYRKTVQNLWLAFVFNGVGIPTAATGVLHPSWAMGAMALSVTLVLANSFGGRLLKRPAPSQLDRPAAKPQVELAGEPAPSPADQVLLLNVPDMHCSGCLETIRANLSLERGVGDIEGDPRSKRLKIAFSSAATSPEAIETAIARLGFRVTGEHQQPA